MPSWADQLLSQLLMEQFDTLLIQCRHIEHMHEGVWFGQNNLFAQILLKSSFHVFSLTYCAGGGGGGGGGDLIIIAY